ncbi:MAG: hypothetical protein ACN4E2_05260 [Nitrospinota bacterium]
MRRVAIFDVGTNTVQFLVATLESGKLKTLFSDQRVTRLGEGLGTSKFLKESAIEKSKVAIAEILEAAKEFEPFELKVVVTYPARVAKNRDLLASKIFEATNAEMITLSWKDEVGLSLQGAMMVIPDKDILLFDIGGGSVEFVSHKNNGVQHFFGTDLGVVSLTEQFIFDHPVVMSQYQNMQDRIEKQIIEGFKKLKYDAKFELVGVAGSVTAVAAIAANLHKYDQGFVNGYQLSYDKLMAVKEQLFAMTLAKRSEIAFLRNGREDLVVAGIGLIETIMKVAKKNKLTVSDYSLREGLAIRMLTDL